MKQILGQINYLSIILAIILLGLSALLFTRNAEPDNTLTYKNISPLELNSQLKTKDFLFVNVHIPYEGEIEKTDLFIPYDEIEKNLDKLPKNKKIILYCRSGRMSQEAADKLIKLGYRKVYNLTGGMHNWQSIGLLIETKRK